METYRILNGLFKIFSGTCVHNPFEVIIMITSLCITLSLLPISNSNAIVNHIPDKILDYFTINGESRNRNYINFYFIMLLRCLAFACVFIQMKSLRKIKSKFILAISIFITLISSILFNKALLNWFNFEIPNFLLLIIDLIIYSMVIIDLKKCNLILNKALEETTSIKEAKTNIAQNFAHFASSSSLDTIFFILLVSLKFERFKRNKKFLFI